MRGREKFFQTGLALVLTLTVISLSVVFTLAFRPLYYLDVELLDISESSGYSREEIRENYDRLIDYNLSLGEAKLEFSGLAMSEAGRIHFQEVREIFHFFEYAAILGSLLGAAGLVWSYRKRQFLCLKLASLLTVILPAGLGLLVALNWDRVFVAFHHLAFDNDYWLFDPLTDPVITILPDTFFLHCALLIFAGVLLGSLLCRLAYQKFR